MNVFDNVGHVSDVVVKQERYDELLHKEALLDAVEKLHFKMSDYAFRDAVGYMLKCANIEKKEDE